MMKELNKNNHLDHQQQQSSANDSSREITLQLHKSYLTAAENKPAEKTNMEMTEALNDEPEKKIIKLSEFVENNLDPLAFFSRFLDIPEIILQHLSGKDVIQFSEVSPSWYNVIAASEDLMENIKIVLNGNLLQEDYDLLKNSSRKYQNIEVRRNFVFGKDKYEFKEFDYISDSELDFLLIKAHDWKSVSINETYFRRKLELLTFLSSIKSTVESFSVIHIRSYKFPFTDADDERTYRENPFRFDGDSSSNFGSFEALKFPKIKHLKMNFLKLSSSTSEVYYQLLVRSPAIEKFEFEAESVIERDSALIKMLENSTKLTTLTLKTFLNEMFNRNPINRYHFKLKSLNLRIQVNGEVINIREFLKFQSDLESLSLEVQRYKEIIPEIMKLTKLKTLELNNFKVYSKDDVPNEFSTSITHLKIKYLVDPVSLKFLLMSVPNLKCLHFSEIDKEIFRVLLEVDRKYEELKVICLRDVEEKDLKMLLIDENKTF